MSETIIPKGYLINQYQYARRYRYNSSGCILYFNQMLKEHEKTQRDYLAFGDFDLLEFVKVNTFRKYYDVSAKAKHWLGKRQSVLLYDISQPIGKENGANIPAELLEKEIKTRIVYDESAEAWVAADNGATVVEGRFFCLSMLSVTNEIIRQYTGLLPLLKLVRFKIHEITDKLNESLENKIHCEVFGSLNATELGIVFICNEFVDVLRLLDSIKHIRVKDEKGEKYSVFLNCYSTIGIRDDLASGILDSKTEIRGKALVQIAIQDITDSRAKLKALAHRIAGDEKASKISFSVGEYDLVVEVSAKRAIHLISPEGEMAVAKKEDGKFFADKEREVLRSNIRLLYTREDAAELDEKLREMGEDEGFFISFTSSFDKSKAPVFEAFELIDDPDYRDDSESGYKRNESYYKSIRRELKNRICFSAGAVDTLDILYTDYKSVLTGAYNAIWVSDLHRQFKSILHAIELMLQNQNMPWSWEDFNNVTNAFKQQIYHLSQSSKLFFEIPSCHLRSTGQYDFLMHAYYGITKKIIEIIYRLQQTDNQSELVPFITVNMVPQVITELFFEIGSNSGMRTVNLNIPNSIIFHPHRGIGYLTHELFHYAVPCERRERNYHLALLYLTLIFKLQVLQELKYLVISGMDLTADNSFEQFFAEPADEYNGMSKFVYYLFNSAQSMEDFILKAVADNYKSRVYTYLEPYQNSIRTKFESVVLDFAYSEESNDLFNLIFRDYFQLLYVQAQKMLTDPGYSNDSLERRFLQRLEYCRKNTDKFDSYIRELPRRRLLIKRNKLHFDRGNDIYSVLYPCRASLNEACADISMVSLNGMTAEEYLFFCVQNWKDNFEATDNDMLLEIMSEEHEQRLRIAFVAEYFYQENAGGWDIGRDERHTPYLSSQTKADFRRAYSWFYARKKRYITPGKDYIEELSKQNRSVRKEGMNEARRLEYEADKWLEFFLDCYCSFRRDYAVFWDSCIKPVLDNYDVNLRLEKLRASDTISKESKEIAEADIDIFQRIQEEYRHILGEMPELSDYIARPDSDSGNGEISAQPQGRYKAFLDALFAQNISVADRFQRQYRLSELGNINKAICAAKQAPAFWSPTVPVSLRDLAVPKNGKEKFSTVFTIHSLNELMFYVRHCSKMLKEAAQYEKVKSKDFLWFRGHVDAEFTLLPSIIRKYDAKKQERYPTLRKYQLSEFEEFKFRADGAAEMPTGVRFTQSDYIALMQHYAVPTNFLDWTENVSTSLYFALEYFFDYKNQKERIKKGYHRDAALYIFSPGLYNHVRNKAMGEALKESGVFAPYFSEMLTHANTIPNLSTKHNEWLYHMYILGKERFDEYLRTQNLNIAAEFKKNINLQKLFLPIAVWTSRLNSRIRTQSGCFVAFNLYSPPFDAEGKNTPFRYCELEQIQNLLLPESHNKYLYKLVIDKSCCEEIVEWLKAMGISRENIYPELERLKDRFD